MANPVLMNGNASPQSVYTVSTTQNHVLGQRAILNDRVFYYAASTGAAITKANVCTIGARTANHLSVAYSSGGAAGSNTITVTLGATAATANQYRHGYMIHIDGTGPGQMRLIKSHPAADSAATLELTLFDELEDAITDGEISLVKSKYDGVIVTPGNADVLPLCVPQLDVPSGTSDTQFFWGQTWGPAAVIGDGSAFTDGSPAVVATAGTGDAGQVTLGSDSTGTGTANDPSELHPLVGIVMEASDATSDGDARLVDLRIQP